MDVPQNLVQWSDDYGLGLKNLDAQHKLLFDLINRLGSAMAREAPPAELDQILESLESYALVHFTAEETLMQAGGFPGFASHKAEHERFAAQVREARLGVQRRGHITLDMLQFLHDWLVDHIQVRDRAYAEDFRRAGRGKAFIERFFTRLNPWPIAARK